MSAQPVPKVSYPKIQSIIHAYYLEGGKVDSVILARNHDMNYSTISSNTKFLTHANILEGDNGKFCLTPQGKKLGKAINDNDDLALSRMWAKIIKDVDYFKRIMIYMERNNFVPYRQLKEYIINITGIPNNAKSFDTISKVIIDIMEIAGVIIVPRGRPKNLIVNFSKTIFDEPDEIYKKDLFVLMPFSDELKPIYYDHIKKVAKELNLSVARADDFFSHSSVMQEIFSAIKQATILIADCTHKNPNVFYEIGLAHALGRPVILITQDEGDVPFDLRHIRYIHYAYTPPGMNKFEEALSLTIKNHLK